MFKKILLATLVAGASFSSSANWVGGLSYTNYSDESDISVSTVNASIGYEYASSEQFSLIPELRLGFGLGDDSVRIFGENVDIEIDTFFAFSVRGQYKFENNMYVFAAPSYGKLELSANSSVGSASDSSTEFGIGAGVGYMFNEKTSAEISFEEFDGTDLISFGIRYAF